MPTLATMAKRNLSRTISLARQRLDAEQGAVIKDWGGRLPLALVYPNSYYLGMSNLGLQTLYGLLNNRSDIVCERAFYDPPHKSERGDDPSLGPVTIESQRPLADFPVVAYTLTYEIDYYHVVRSLQAAQIEPLSINRDDGDPLIIAGGAAVITNPLPLADCFDAFVIGEAEPILEELIDTLQEYAYSPRADQLEALARIPGVFVPALGSGDGVERQWVRDISTTEAMSLVLTDETEFNQMTLIEAARGCGRGCRFCIAGYVFRPPRYRPLESLLNQVQEGLKRTERVGLLGAAVADHPQLAELAVQADKLGGRVSVSSLRVDNLAPELLDVLSRGGTRTVTLAPEAGSERMRQRINKAVSEDQIIEAADKVGAAAMNRLKLYFMIGLPDEEDEDVEAMANLGLAVKERLDAHGHGTELVMSFGRSARSQAGDAYQETGGNPRPDWSSIAQQILQTRIPQDRHPNACASDSPTWARIDDICSRSDQRLAHAILEMGSAVGPRVDASRRGMESRRTAALGRRTKSVVGCGDRHYGSFLRARAVQTPARESDHRLPTARDWLQHVRRLRRQRNSLVLTHHRAVGNRHCGSCRWSLRCRSRTICVESMSRLTISAREPAATHPMCNWSPSQRRFQSKPSPKRRRPVSATSARIECRKVWPNSTN